MVKFYEELDELFLGITNFLMGYNQSNILKNYFFEAFESFSYSNLINKLFLTINKENSELDEENKENNIISVERIVEFNLEYKNVREDINSGLLMSLNNKKVDEEYYHNFKYQIKKDFPDFLGIILKIEEEIGINQLKVYLDDKKEELKDIGRSKGDFDSFVLTTALESYVNGRLGSPQDMIENLDRIVEVVVEKSLPKFSGDVFKSLKKKGRDMLVKQREYQEKFENSLYQKWKEPLDLLESLIRVSMESGELHANKILENNDSNKFKKDAIIKIHARALQISNEIFVLLKSGYADGANARWRSLHELAVISFFLLENDNEVSERYLKYEVVERFNEAKDYKTQCKKLGYPPIDQYKFEKLKEEKDRLCEIYDDNFSWSYGWIPSSILSERSFKALEEHVNLNDLRPFYKFSSASVHGNSRGLYRLGVRDDYQDKVLLCGTSDYGLADPLETTAISLFHITICLLNLEPDYESMFHIQLMKSFVEELGPKAVKVQKKLEDINHYNFWI